MERIIIALVAVLFTTPHAPAQEATASRVFGGARIQEIYRVRLDCGDLLLETILDTIPQEQHPGRRGAHRGRLSLRVHARRVTVSAWWVFH